MHRLRRATLDDLDFLVRIDLDDEGVTPGYREEWGEVEATQHRAKIKSFITGDDKGALIAESDSDKRIGAILWRYRDASKEDFAVENVFREIRSVFPPDGRFCEVFQLWVDPAHRRQGIATALKQAAESDAVARGVGMIYTHTEERNDHVVALNAKLGYFEVRRGPIWDEVVRVSLVKRLGPAYPRKGR
jgi:ribosomal protein S18 acetylase RimI-like enzyme